MASRPKYCIKCGDKRTELPGGICQACVRAENPPERRWRPCEVCGETTTSKKGTHPACRLAEDPGAPVGLPDGDWRFDPFRRVQVYVLKPEPEPEPVDPDAPIRKGCDSPFELGDPRQKYCTHRCRKRAGQARRDAAAREQRNAA
ncbi:MAG TPA: hypothetical protein VJL80_14565 [Aeromicrobium sp.]|nr:hypothetical protein [Aeromicrobium sp.]HKY59257.1 hypothetical protein [Aeromicrobium sp.]